MIKYQSETIEFEVPLPFSASEIQRAVVYFYTHSTFISKYSITTSDGYNTITFDGGKLKGKIPSEDTKKMLGVLKMDVLVVDNNGLRYIDSPATDVRIEHNPITAEK